MKKRFGKRLLIMGGLVMGLMLVISMGIHPYLAVTAPVEAKVAVVEGWIPEPLFPAVKEEIERRGYTSIFTTGTVRSFSYHLTNGEAIVVRFEKPLEGEVRINVVGLPDAGFHFVAGMDTLISFGVGPHSQRYSTHLPHPIDSITIHSYNNGQPPADMANIYVKYLLISGTNAHRIPGKVELIGTDGTRDHGWPTFAHSAAARLQELGIPEDHLHITPASDGPESRTLANAAGFAVRARELGITKVDVISLGVHARRSRKMFRKACGAMVEVGVIAMPDPEVQRGSWWRNSRGWVRMVKEMSGVPASSLFEVPE